MRWSAVVDLDAALELAKSSALEAGGLLLDGFESCRFCGARPECTSLHGERLTYPEHQGEPGRRAPVSVQHAG